MKKQFLTLALLCTVVCMTRIQAEDMPQEYEQVLTEEVLNEIQEPLQELMESPEFQALSEEEQQVQLAQAEEMIAQVLVDQAIEAEATQGEMEQGAQMPEEQLPATTFEMPIQNETANSQDLQEPLQTISQPMTLAQPVEAPAIPMDEFQSQEQSLDPRLIENKNPTIKQALRDLGTATTNVVMDSKVVQMPRKAYRTVKNTLQNAYETSVDGVKNVVMTPVDGVKDAANFVADGTKRGYNAVTDATVNAANSIGDVATNVAGKVQRGVKKAAQGVTKPFKNAKEATERFGRRVKRLF